MKPPADHHHAATAAPGRCSLMPIAAASRGSRPGRAMSGPLPVSGTSVMRGASVVAVGCLRSGPPGWPRCGPPPCAPDVRRARAIGPGPSSFPEVPRSGDRRAHGEGRGGAVVRLHLPADRLALRVERRAGVLQVVGAAGVAAAADGVVAGRAVDECRMIRRVAVVGHDLDLGHAAGPLLALLALGAGLAAVALLALLAAVALLALGAGLAAVALLALLAGLAALPLLALLALGAGLAAVALLALLALGAGLAAVALLALGPGPPG